MRDEIIKKLSPYLLYMYEHEYIVITKSSTSDGGTYTIENKLNGSTISVMPCLDSSRGSRSTMNIYEESRLLKRSIVNSVFEPMGHARQAKYLLNPKYNTKRWQETARSIYISSARYSYEWFAKKFRETVTKYYTSRHEVYTPFAQDIFTAIEDGSRTWADYRKNKNSMTSSDFRMEILNEMFNENEDSFFELKSFKENQVLKECFTPPTTKDIFMGKEISMSNKSPNEIRLIIADLAFAGNSSIQQNDHTVFMCMSLHWKKFRFERRVDYIETRPGGGADKVVLRLKELYYDYKADYIVFDNRAGGETIYDFLSGTTDHPERGAGWNNSGFSVVQDTSIQIVPYGKIEELSRRTVDKNAIPCLVSFIGTAEVNSRAWQSLKKQLDTNNIKFLVNASEKQAELEENGLYYNLDSEELAEVLAPYAQTEELISECVNLSAEFRNGMVRLQEPKSGFKDRAVVLAYGNFIAEKLDTKYAQSNQETDYNIEDFDLVW